MPKIFAVSGKGGTGKTSIAACLVRSLAESGRAPVLAVDADPNSSLADALELKCDSTLADIREVKQPPQGMSKPDFVLMAIEKAISERPGCDLLVMGRPEGPGCYCAVNNLLRDSLSRIAKRYQYVVMDNEAGMEHLSRRTTDNVDVLLIIATPDAPALRAAQRVLDTARGNKLSISHTLLLLNQASREPDEPLAGIIRQLGVERVLLLPHSPALRSAAEHGKGIPSLPDDDPLLAAISGQVLGALDDLTQTGARA